MRVASFEVLDTLLTRRFAAAEDVFLALGRELRAAGLIVCEREGFAQKRRDAERHARLAAPKGEATLAEIYDALARLLHWTPEQAEAARDLELELEEENLVIVPGALDSVRTQREGTDGAIFLVETHLPSVFIEGVLRREGFYEEGDKLFVSCELRLPKASGELFERVRSQYPGIQDWTHTGMDTLRDVNAPRRLGMNVIKRPQCRLTRFEELARGGGSALRLWRSRLAGAMRLARLEAQQPPGPRAVIAELAADISGPFVFGFVHWCLVEAAERSLKRLCFLGSRGKFLARVAARVAAVWQLPVEPRALASADEAACRAAGLLEGVACGVAEFGWDTTRVAAVASVVRASGHGVADLEAGFFLGLPRPGPSAGNDRVVLPYLDATTLRRHNLRLVELFAGIGVAAELLPVLQDGVEDFAKHWLAAVNSAAFEPDEFRAIAGEVLGELELHPARAEAKAIPALAADGRFMPEMSVPRALAAVVNPAARPPAWWREGSLVLRPCWPLRGAVALGHLLRR